MESQPRSKGRGSFLSSIRWKDVLKVALSFGLIGFVLSKTSLQQIIDLKERITWSWLVVSFVFFILTTLFKTLQYWKMLGGRASYRQTLKIVIIQNALTNFVTSAAGIASYLAMFKMDQNVKARHSGAVFILTKAGDMFAMGFFLLLSASLVWTRVDAFHELIVLILVITALGLTIFWAAIFLRQTFVRILRKIIHRLHLDRFSIVTKGLGVLESLSVQEPHTIRRVMFLGEALSLLYMTATMAYGFSRMYAFQIPIDLWAIVFIISVMQFISIIPIQVFGGLGVTEISLVYLFGLFGITQDIPAILVSLRVLVYLFNLALLAYIPLDTFFARRTQEKS